MLTLTTGQMKQVERLADEGGLSYAQMMENAGAMAYQYLAARYEIASRSCVILAGSGNNGGDGFVLARHIAEAGGSPVVVLCCGLPRTELAIAAYNALAELEVGAIDFAADPDLACACIDQAQVIVDAVFGTGFHGEIGGPLAALLQRVNASPATRVALDIPSGMNADTGDSGEACLHADVTLAFAACKPAHSSLIGRASCGRVEVLDIGIPEGAVLAALNNVTELTPGVVSGLLPVRHPESHKGTYGKLLNISGSICMGGAAMMSTLAALRCGTGTTTLATPRTVAHMVAPQLMEAMTLPLEETAQGSLSVSCLRALDAMLPKMTACLMGCGLTASPDVKQAVEHVLREANCTLVLDADALNCLRENPDLLLRARRTPIITPHLGEMARLCEMTVEQVAENAISVAKLFAKEKNAVVVLKGHHTIVATPTGELYRNTTGNAGLAKGGSGDVLAGMIASFAAQGMSPRDAAVCGVFLHGYAADRLAERMSQYAMLARDLIAELSVALKALGR